MKKINVFLLAGILFLAILVLIPSCKKEIYTDADALAAMKEGLKYKNDLAKELATLDFTNQLQLEGLRSQLSIKEMIASDSLNRIGARTIVSVQVMDVTGTTSNMSGFSVTVNQSGKATTLTTDANGLVVFPNFVTGSASVVVVKAGFARASGIMLIEGGSNKETTQQAVIVPVFPTESAAAKISGTLTAQLDLTTEAKEVVKDGVVSLNFNDIWEIFDNPNSTFNGIDDYGLIGVVYDGGFMQTVKTGVDGKYEFKVPKTQNPINYSLSVSTIQKKQKLIFGDYPNKLDTIKLDSMLTWFGYYPFDTKPVWDQVRYSYRDVSGNPQYAEYAGVNIVIDAPKGGQKPTSPADITWVHNDSTVVTWSFTKFAYGNGSAEVTNITQAPVFVFEPDLDYVKVVTPAVGVVNINNGKLISLYMTNGGIYKEYGRSRSPNGNVAPLTVGNPVFKFFEQLADEDVNGVVKGDTTYQTAIAKVRPAVKNQGKVKIPFKLTNDIADGTRKGKGYTAIPNVEFKLRIHTPGGTGSESGSGVAGDSTYIFTKNDLGVHLLVGGGISIDTLVAGTSNLPALKDINQVYTTWTPIISTSKYNGAWQLESSYNTVVAIGVGSGFETWKCDLLNGFKIMDGGLGYKTAPIVKVTNSAMIQGYDGGWNQLTIAEATTTIDAAGRIISVSDPVMLDNFMIRFNMGSRTFYSNNTITVPTDVAGLVQAYARPMVNEYGTIETVLLYDENIEQWRQFPATYASGKGYITTPEVKVNPVGKTSVAIPAILKAEVNSDGRVSNITIVDGGKGYDVKNDPTATKQPEYLIKIITTNGTSNIQYDIDMGSGWHGKAIDIFD